MGGRIQADLLRVGNGDIVCCGRGPSLTIGRRCRRTPSRAENGPERRRPARCVAGTRAPPHSHRRGVVRYCGHAPPERLPSRAGTLCRGALAGSVAPDAVSRAAQRRAVGRVPGLVDGRRDAHDALSLATHRARAAAGGGRPESRRAAAALRSQPSLARRRIAAPGGPRCRSRPR